MRKVLVYVITAVLAVGLLSCDGKQEKAENLEDLKSKYDGKEFKNCDEFLEAADEIIDVFVIIINKAAEGDEASMDEIDEMEKFMNQFEKQAEGFEEECPEKFEEFQKNAEEKMADAVDKLMELMMSDMDWDYDEEAEWDEEWDEELAEEIEEE
jgi:hypothetical protein